VFRGYTHNINTKVQKEQIFKNQKKIFKNYLGVTPSISSRLHSPFRSDRNPDCRFTTHEGIWYFIDNATYKGKLTFNCIELVMYMFEVNFKQACNMISQEVDLSGQEQYENYLFKPVIKFKYSKWPEDNYFTRNYGISTKYLDQQPYYYVTDYYTNSKNNLLLTKNTIYNPRNVETIAYHFDERVKLYFPNQDIRFYSSCNNDDIFGFHRFGDYLFSNDVIITKSGKDEMVANYHLGLATLAVQQETTRYLPDKVLRNLNRFDNIYVWYDADYTGLAWSKYMVNYLNSHFPNKAKGIYHKLELGNDIAEIYENYGKNLLKITYENCTR